MAQDPEGGADHPPNGGGAGGAAGMEKSGGAVRLARSRIVMLNGGVF